MPLLPGPASAASGVYTHNCPHCGKAASFPVGSGKLMPDGYTVEFSPCSCGAAHFINLQHPTVLSALGRTDEHCKPISDLKAALQALGWKV